MRLTALLSLLVLTAASLGAQTAPTMTFRNPAVLSPDTVMTVYARFGMVTAITLITDKPIQSILKGGPEINTLRQGNVISIQPTVPTGLSSLNIRVANITYVIRVRIQAEDPAVPNPVFTFAAQGRFEDLDRVIAGAPPMKPSDIDLQGAVRTVERADAEPEFLATLHNYAALPIGKVYQWNHNDLHLISAYQFADLDLIVFKIAWVNQQGTAFYLNQNQYKLFIGDKAVPVIASSQLAPRSIVFPGQEEVVWLAVQGYKLRLDNDWDLRLPPEAADLRSFTRTD